MATLRDLLQSHRVEVEAALDRYERAGDVVAAPGVPREWGVKSGEGLAIQSPYTHEEAQRIAKEWRAWGDAGSIVFPLSTRPEGPSPARRRLAIVLNAGSSTCASAPGTFCRFLGVRQFGTVYVCRLFPSVEAAHTDLTEVEGWLQRLPECLASEGIADVQVQNDGASKGNP